MFSSGPNLGSFRLLICGGGGFTDRAKVFKALDAAHARRPIDRLLEGSDSSAVKLAGLWAAEHRCIRESCSELWPGQGREPRLAIEDGSVHAVIAFPGDDGTTWAIRAESAGLPVWRPYG